MALGQIPWSEISPLLDEALELSPEELPKWLDNLDTTFPSIAKEVRALLADRAILDAKGFMQSGAIGDDEVPHALAGRRIGAYTLESLLGEGGMGTVWLARRSDGRFEGHVAIKLLNFALVGRPSEQRFTREGSVLARLKHPNISQLVDAGVAEHGQPYLVLEYAQGERINAHCDREKLDVPARIRLFLDVLAAVAHAHSHLVVHRDLKPANIMVTGGGIVKLLDFGIAALLAGEADKPELTREIGAMLTPEYAAPEQLTEGAITTATDVYALGLILFLLLVGRHPLAEPGQARAELLVAMLEKEAPTASGLAIDPKAKRALRGDLDRIIEKALRRDPAQRYPTAAAFADDLRRFLAFEPVAARRGSFGYKASRFVRRNALPIGISAAVAMALIGTTVFALEQMVDAREQRDSAQFEARRAEASSEFLSLIFEEVGSTGAPLSNRELLDRGVALLERQNGGDPAVLSRMLVQASRRYLDMGELIVQRKLLDQAIGLAEPAKAWDVLATAHCAGVRGYLENGNVKAAQDELRLGQDALAHLQRQAVDSEVNCLRAAVVLLANQGRFAEGLETIREARVLLESTGSIRGSQYTSVLNDEGFLYFRTGRHPEALAILENVAKIFERNGRGGTIAMTVILNNITSNLNQMGETLASEARMREIAARQSAGGPNAFFHVNRAAVVLRLERFDEAHDLLEKALASARASGDGEVEVFALNGLARLNILRGDLAQAQALMEQTTAKFAASPEAFSIARKQTSVLRVEWLLAKGELTAAREQGTAVLERAGDDPEHLDRPILKLILPPMARISLRQNDPAQARAYASRALELGKEVSRPGGHSGFVGEALVLIGEAQLLAGERAEAARTFAEALPILEGSLGPEHSLTRRARSL